MILHEKKTCLFRAQSAKANPGMWAIVIPKKIGMSLFTCQPVFFGAAIWAIPSGELSHSNGKSPCYYIMGKSTISMAIFNCYVSSPEGIENVQPARWSQVCMAGGALTALCYACCPFLSDATAWRDGGGLTMAPCCAFRPSLHMYALYIYIYTCICMCVCVCVSTALINNIWYYIFLFICIHLCNLIYMYEHAYIYMYVYMYIYMYVCVYAYVYIYMYMCVCACYVYNSICAYICTVYLFSETAKRKTHPESTEDSKNRTQLYTFLSLSIFQQVFQMFPSKTMEHGYL